MDNTNLALNKTNKFNYLIFEGFMFMAVYGPKNSNKISTCSIRQEKHNDKKAQQWYKDQRINDKVATAVERTTKER